MGKCPLYPPFSYTTVIYMWGRLLLCRFVCQKFWFNKSCDYPILLVGTYTKAALIKGTNFFDFLNSSFLPTRSSIDNLFGWILLGFLFLFSLLISIYIFKYETIVGRNGLSLGYSERDTSSVISLCQNLCRILCLSEAFVKYL